MFKMNKSGTAKKIKNTIYLQAFSFSPSGAHLDGKVFIIEDNNIKTLGQGILNALKESNTSIDYVLDKNKVRYMWEAAGFKAWKSFDKKSYSVEFELEKNKISFSPDKFVREGYYEGANPPPITTDDLSPESLGKCLLEAFELSENFYLDK